MSTYNQRKERAKYRPTKPTKTDQSQANDTDINVIVKRYAATGVAPGNAAEPMHGDFTGLPRDLRGLIEQARSIERLRGELPKELQNLTVEDLVVMDNDALKAYLQPAKPANTPDTKPEGDKK